MTFNVNDRVVVRIDYRDESGTVTRVRAGGRYVVVTDSGDCRTWNASQITPATKLGGGR